MWYVLLVLALTVTGSSDAYGPNWPELDRRPLPGWFDSSKFGIFCHWGLYSVPSFHSEWFWWHWQGDPDPKDVEFMKRNYKPGFAYADFAPLFTAEFFDANRFANVVKQSGAKYFVLTSKHHEGYTMWPSNYSWNWNAMDVGPHRDLLGELRTAFDKSASNIHFGLYFSQFEWFNRQYINDRNTNFTASNYVQEVSFPQMLEIVNSYHPEVIWSDGDWEAPDSYWKSREFLAWLYTESPVKDTVVVNDRWGNNDIYGKHGDFYNYADHFDPGHLLPHKWENCMTLDQESWGFRRTMTAGDVHSVQSLIEQLARTVSCGGNLLLNVGPTYDGRIVPIFEERLEQLGTWLRVNGEAIYDTKPWIHQNDSNVWYTSKVRSSHGLAPERVFNPQRQANTVVYAIVLEWPSQGNLVLPSIKVTDKSRAKLLGQNGYVPISPISSGGGKINLAAIDWRTLPSYDAWVLQLEFLGADDRDPIEELKCSGHLTEDGYPTRALRLHAEQIKAKKNERSGEEDDDDEDAMDHIAEIFFKKFAHLKEEEEAADD